jgi:hypothetical protein
MVKKTRGGRARQELGEFYLLNWRINGVTESFVDLEKLGREVRVLADWERWADESQ